jgi:hypothetical protein
MYIHERQDCHSSNGTRSASPGRWPVSATGMLTAKTRDAHEDRQQRSGCGKFSFPKVLPFRSWINKLHLLRQSIQEHSVVPGELKVASCIPVH